MTREQHLEFCNICAIRKFTYDQGIVCRLTGQIADFEDKCLSFSIDPIEYQKSQIKNLNESIDKYVDSHSEYYFIERVSNKFLKKYPTINEVPKEVSISDNVYYRIIFVVVGLFVVFKGITEFDSEFAKNPIAGYFILTIATLYLIYFAFKTTKLETEFVISSKGIKRGTTLLEWKNIEFILLMYARRRKFLAVRTNDGATTELDVASKNYSKRKIIHFCHLHLSEAKK